VALDHGLLDDVEVGLERRQHGMSCGGDLGCTP
jgi:hypothetical protein